ncbi:DUF3124 domain-containing protein [Dethiosulfatarculus sandiegensis]|uniref:DUF3124 domain-containing protein n=1 Tax=Dethiosulfatarculus sandiegensis TaxID=1429043 RepID=UPI0018D1B816|nr:DUF3124 domain-containing protein [Dethiosulfatarculus sandiegensis]
MIAFFLSLFAAPAQAGENYSHHTVYAAVYRSIQHNHKGGKFGLVNTLCVRNTDQKKDLIINAVDLYGPKGEKIKSFLAKPLKLKPLACQSFVAVPADKKEKKIAASFLVHYKIFKKANRPLIHCVTIGATMNQGISFISEGRELN